MKALHLFTGAILFLAATRINGAEDTRGVYHVQNEANRSERAAAEPCYARRGDEISVWVSNLNAWLNDPDLKDRLPKDAKIPDLMPFINDVPLKGIHPEQSWPDPHDPTVHYLRFSLKRTEASKEGWTHLLNRPVFTRPMKLSVGFENGEQITTWVQPGAAKPINQFYLIVIPPKRFWLGAVVIVGAFLVFLYLARCTDIIRDTTAPLRPDKRWPYSLSRAQMAFWFFLVIGSFFFLWVITGDYDTLNSSVLALIGISAGTALSAAFVDSGRTPPADAKSDLPPEVDLSKPRRNIAEQIRNLIAEARERLKAIEAQRADVSAEETAELEANTAAQERETQKINDLERQLDYFEWPAWKGVMHDLMAENNIVCFHRFQIFIWTIVLGIMFVVDVYNRLAMPEFSATLLGLLGISAGTFVGFKLPEPKPKPAGAD